MAEENGMVNPEQQDAEQGQTQSKGRMQEAMELGGTAMGVLAVGFALVFLGLTVIYISLGILYLFSCRVQPMIPIWLIVYGTVCLILIVAGISDKKNKTELAYLKTGLKVILLLFAFCWFIAGNVWVFGTLAKNPDFENLRHENSCHKGLFYFALICGVIFPYASIALAVIIMVSVWVCKRIDTNS
ncbi:transmembrane protein 272-like [Penaeus chinensis]|uniref:transmembrane protein 272-like n=1 Tax=Penaeus chinensis TaxID=139456 RepID=UPI001FB7196F|nr:transmembrane protein 272-like [Penaeus chinensis]